MKNQKAIPKRRPIVAIIAVAVFLLVITFALLWYRMNYRLVEYENGNYCVAGGDFNKDLLGNSAEIFGVAGGENDTWAQPIPEGTIPDGLSLVVPFDVDHPVATCRTANEPYNEETTFRVTVDGFLVSDNVEVVSADVVDAGYRYSDHNPIYMDFILKAE